MSELLREGGLQQDIDDQKKQKKLEPVIQGLLKMSNLAIFNPRLLVITESV